MTVACSEGACDHVAGLLTWTLSVLKEGASSHAGFSLYLFAMLLKACYSLEGPAASSSRSESRVTTKAAPNTEVAERAFGRLADDRGARLPVLIFLSR